MSTEAAKFHDYFSKKLLTQGESQSDGLYIRGQLSSNTTFQLSDYAATWHKEMPRTYTMEEAARLRHTFLTLGKACLDLDVHGEADHTFILARPADLSPRGIWSDEMLAIVTAWPDHEEPVIYDYKTKQLITDPVAHPYLHGTYEFLENYSNNSSC